MSFRNAALAIAALAILSSSQAFAGHGTGGDPYVYTNWDGDHLWSNPGNWNQPEPPGPGHVAWVNNTTDVAIIDYAAPSIAELVIGQGGGDGHVRMTSGGSITTSHVNLAWGAGRSGILDVDGGAMNVGELRVGRGVGGVAATVNVSGGTLYTTGPVQLSSRTDEGGHVGAASFVTVSGGTLRAGGLHANGHGTADIQVGHLGGPATMQITGGSVLGNAVLVANLGTTTATGSLSITGGELRALQIGVGASGGTGVGHFTIGGDALVRTANHIFLRPDGRGNFTVNGSEADIQLNRLGSTGFEVTNGSLVTFNGDLGGFSTVNIPQSTMRFSGANGILNVDATATRIGTYDLFTFGAGYFNTGFTSFGVHNLNAGAGRTAQVLYNPNSIQLHLVPEPGSLCLLAVGGAVLLVRRRRS